MKSRGGKFLLLIGAVLAAMAFIVVYVVMSGKLNLGSAPATDVASVPTAVPMVSVAVVNRDIPAYTMLDSTNVATIDMEASTVPSGTTTAPAAVFGKMTLVPLAKGQPVRQDQLTETGFSNILAKGERAFSLAVPEKSTFGNAVTENDFVDLIWTVNMSYDRVKPGADVDGKPTYETASFTSTKTLLQNVHVLRVIELAQDVPAGQAQKNQQATSETSANTATGPAPVASSMYLNDAPYRSVLVLGLTDQQAEIVTYARLNGYVDLVLRSSALQKDETGAAVKDATGADLRGDKDLETTTGVTLETLIKQYGLLAPVTTAP
ncbi:MAG: Flp pilus assembly protein CpaB [Chloroflexia bacterium]